MSDSVRPHRQQPTRLPCPWDSPGKNTGVGCHFLLQCMKVTSESEVAQSCSTLRDPMDYSLPGSSVHGILQARILEWVAISFSRRPSQPRDGTHVSCTSPALAGGFLLLSHQGSQNMQVWNLKYRTVKLWMDFPLCRKSMALTLVSFKVQSHIKIWTIFPYN